MITHHGGRPEVLVFGSTARGDARPESDIDLVVELESGRSLLDRVKMALALESLLGHPVETVSRAALHPLLRDQILLESCPL